jgi:hypothetical protein
MLVIQASPQILEFGIPDSKRSLRNDDLAVLPTHCTPRHEPGPTGQWYHFILDKALPFGPLKYS